MPGINSGDTTWVLVSSALVLLMTPGLAFFYGGMVRRKNVLNTMMSSYGIMGLASIMWVAIGFSMAFGPDFGGVIGGFNWAGLSGVGGAPNPGYAPTIPALAFAIFQMMFAIITPALITGAVAERMKYSAQLIFTLVWSIVVYYPLAHMMWGTGGWLKNLGALDFAGGNVVHVSAGVSALVACILLGKRKHHGVSSPTPHNIPFVLLGAGLLWFGWFGFNAGSALSSGALAAHAFLTTNTSAAAALLSWMLIERIFNKKPTALGAATGIVVGLAAITPAAGFVPIWAAIVIGFVVSPLSWFGISFLKRKLGYDDALDVFGCHGIGCIWGGIATGLFASSAVNPAVTNQGLIFGTGNLMVSQLIAIGITIALAGGGTFVIMKVIGLFTKPRVTLREESDGLDHSQHGESAYPSFTGLD
ncbi:MAG: ammonium transporter [Bacillota bacterium]|nr:ammonium transporter [Bacillota bacterium]